MELPSVQGVQRRQGCKPKLRMTYEMCILKSCSPFWVLKDSVILYFAALLLNHLALLKGQLKYSKHKTKKHAGSYPFPQNKHPPSLLCNKRICAFHGKSKPAEDAVTNFPHPPEPSPHYQSTFSL